VLSTNVNDVLSTPKIAPYLSSADARQFLVVFHVHNLELPGAHAGVGAERPLTKPSRATLNGRSRLVFTSALTFISLPRERK
jgi:hypothetical protein